MPNTPLVNAAAASGTVPTRPMNTLSVTPISIWPDLPDDNREGQRQRRAQLAAEIDEFDHAGTKDAKPAPGNVFSHCSSCASCLGGAL